MCDKKGTEIGALIVRICEKDSAPYPETIRQPWAAKILVWSAFDDFEFGFDANDNECIDRVYDKTITLADSVLQYFHEHYADELPEGFDTLVKDQLLDLVKDRWAIVNSIDKNSLHWPA